MRLVYLSAVFQPVTIWRETSRGPSSSYSFRCMRYSSWPTGVSMSMKTEYRCAPIFENSPSYSRLTRAMSLAPSNTGTRYSASVSVLGSAKAVVKVVRISSVRSSFRITMAMSAMIRATSAGILENMFMISCGCFESFGNKVHVLRGESFYGHLGRRGQMTKRNVTWKIPGYRDHGKVRAPGEIPFFSFI
ncbi:hypothetical protein ATCV1_z854L [Acanthocystis turfacea chlorella virus 1]|uniref:Uncharacterized protein z854L n=1 Tax=Chlorovirus heliozoae TaxID=322019 RepID=A7KAB4_9PHYC|nr:hypothetical protein ATCV1_z854L [Acanthocystis turfacea chlorella virus 1]ABT16988.1 hypothetical protein ATCV1_z854L [Acanthocystis turfacea chlorella virus 1]